MIKESKRVIQLRNGYWDIEIDPVSSRITSMKVDSDGLGDYSQEMLVPGLGGESIIETADGSVSSGESRSHSVETTKDEKVLFRNVSLGDIAAMDVTLGFEGKEGKDLSLRVTRRVLKSVQAVTDLVFGLQCFREFAFWSRPSKHFGHDPAGAVREKYSANDDVMQRRVIGWHNRSELDHFTVHGSPSYPDFRLEISSGAFHLETRYARDVVFGISSGDLSSAPASLEPGEESYSIVFKPVTQGELAPVFFESENAKINRFVPGFFDGYLLSAIASDHEYFGNNPCRHAYCPGAVHHVTRGYLVSSSDRWDAGHGMIEDSWKKHIRRTINEGMTGKDKFAILMDSGVWQDCCGGHKGGAPGALDLCFALSCLHVILKTGDKEFAREVYPILRNVCHSISACDSDGDGLLEYDSPGTPGSPSSSYNDAMSMGYKDGYLNAVAYEAFTLFASAAEHLNKTDDALFFKEKAQAIKTEYNKQLWDEEKGCYVGWIDIEGTSHNFWFTFTNFLAVAAGIVPEDRLKKMMKSFFDHPNHHRIFAGGMNLDVVDDGSYLVNDGIFGLWLNGGVLLGPASFELYARAVYDEEKGWEMLSDLISQWEKDSLSVTPLFDWCNNSEFGNLRNKRLRYTGGNAYTWIDGKGATSAGTEPYLADGGAMLWSLYTGVLGLRFDFQKLEIHPRIPKELENCRIKLRMMGKTFEVLYAGYGRTIKQVLKNEKVTGCSTFSWDDIADGDTIKIHLDKI